MPSLRANLNDHTFRSLNLLYRTQNSWILEERSLDALIGGKCAHATGCTAQRSRRRRRATLAFTRDLTASTGQDEGLKRQASAENRQDKNLSHRVGLEI